MSPESWKTTVKISDVLARAAELLAPTWSYEGPVCIYSYPQRVQSKTRHRFICHAVLQAWQELEGRPYVWPYSWSQWVHNNEVIRYLRSLGMPAMIEWRGETPKDQQAIRLMFLEFAYYNALEKDV